MNILIIDNSVAFTGAFKCALNEAELLSGKHTVSFVLPTNSTLTGMVKEKGYSVYTLPLKEIGRSVLAISTYPFLLLSNLIALKRIVKQERIEVVQMNDFYNLLGALLKITGYQGKVITWVRFLPLSIPSPLRALWTKAGQKYSDKVIAVSDAVLSQLPKQSNTVRLYDPVNFADEGKEATRSADGVVQLLFLGNYTRGKGQEHAIEAFAKAYKLNKNIRLKIAGGDMGLAKNVAFREELVKQAACLGLSDVISIESFVMDVAAEIMQSDILLNFSEGESFSMTCLEAGFYGRPVIVTRCGGPEEIVSQGETGLLVPIKDTDAMSKAILLLSNNTQLRKQYGKRAKEYVSRKFSPKTFIEQLEAMLTGDMKDPMTKPVKPEPAESLSK